MYIKGSKTGAALYGFYLFTCVTRGQPLFFLANVVPNHTTAL